MSGRVGVGAGDVYFPTPAGYQGFQSDGSAVSQKFQTGKSSSSNLLSASVVMNIIAVLISGFLCSIPFEIMIRADEKSGYFTALFLHLYTVLEGVPKACTNNYLWSSKLPISWHLLFMTLSFLFVKFKTEAMENMSMPLFIIGSNMQVVTGVIVGTLFESKRYSSPQILSVLLVTCGCITATMNWREMFFDKGFMRTLYGFVCIITAVSILTFLVSASGFASKKFNADIPEQIFRQHLFAIPLFLLEWDSIGPRFSRWADKKIYTYSHPYLRIPDLYLLLIMTTVFAQINRYMSNILSGT